MVWSVPTFTDQVLVPTSSLNQLSTDVTLLSQPPMWIAVGALAGNLAPAGTEGLAALTPTFDPGGLVVPGSNIFTVPVSGVWQVSWNASFYTTAGQEGKLMVMCNSVRVASDTATSNGLTSSTVFASVSAPVFALAGQQMLFYASSTQPGGSAFNPGVASARLVYRS